MQPNTHLCLSMLLCHQQPTWELHLHPALCNHSVIMSHCTSFLFNNLLAVFHIKWIIQQQTLFLIITTAAVMLHAHRVPSKVCWKCYLLSSSILWNRKWGLFNEVRSEAQHSSLTWTKWECRTRRQVQPPPPYTTFLPLWSTFSTVPNLSDPQLLWLSLFPSMPRGDTNICFLYVD